MNIKVYMQCPNQECKHNFSFMAHLEQPGAMGIRQCPHCSRPFLGKIEVQATTTTRNLSEEERELIADDYNFEQKGE